MSTVMSQGSIGLAPANTSAADVGSSGVVRKTPANNKDAYNPAGTGGSSTNRSAGTAGRVSTPGGRNVIGQKGRTVAGSGKSVGDK